MARQDVCRVLEAFKRQVRQYLQRALIVCTLPTLALPAQLDQFQDAGNALHGISHHHHDTRIGKGFDQCTDPAAHHRVLTQVYLVAPVQQQLAFHTLAIMVQPAPPLALRHFINMKDIDHVHHRNIE